MQAAAAEPHLSPTLLCSTGVDKSAPTPVAPAIVNPATCAHNQAIVLRFSSGTIRAAYEQGEDSTVALRSIYRYIISSGRAHHVSFPALWENSQGR